MAHGNGKWGDQGNYYRSLAKIAEWRGGDIKGSRSGLVLKKDFLWAR
jgi:hypothetical protein